MNYRKKLENVFARQWQGDAGTGLGHLATLASLYLNGKKVEPDDWIIEDGLGGLSVCHPDIFAATYEPLPIAAPAN